MEVLAKFKTFLQDYGLEATLRAFEKEVAGIAKIHMDSQTSKSYTKVLNSHSKKSRSSAEKQEEVAHFGSVNSNISKGKNKAVEKELNKSGDHKWNSNNSKTDSANFKNQRISAQSIGGGSFSELPDVEAKPAKPNSNLNDSFGPNDDSFGKHQDDSIPDEEHHNIPLHETKNFLAEINDNLFGLSDQKQTYGASKDLNLRYQNSNQEKNVQQNESPQLGAFAAQYQPDEIFQPVNEFQEEHHLSQAMNHFPPLIITDLKAIPDPPLQTTIDLTDPGFYVYPTDDKTLGELSKALAKKFPYLKSFKPDLKTIQKHPQKDGFYGQESKRAKITAAAQKKMSKLNLLKNNSKLEDLVGQKAEKYNIYLPEGVTHPKSGSLEYPRIESGSILDCFNLKMITPRERTILEANPNLVLPDNSFVAGRYQILRMIGKTGFCKVYSSLDIETNTEVCLKVIEGTKTFLDQCLEEVKMIRFVNNNGDPDTHHFLKMIDFFYCREHLFIVTELLGMNLFEYAQFRMSRNLPPFYTLPVLKNISYQLLISLGHLHSLNLIHCDLKPENVLFQSLTTPTVKLIDFGSCTFFHDEPAFYMQTRPYRAPELILSAPYDEKIDIWSLGCMLVELFTGVCLFEGKSVKQILAKIISLLGEIPEEMKLLSAQNLNTHHVLVDHDAEFGSNNSIKNKVGHFTQEGFIWQECVEEARDSRGNVIQRRKRVELIVPKKLNLRDFLSMGGINGIGTLPEESEDLDLFISLVLGMLTIDPVKRLSASEAMNHPFFDTLKNNRNQFTRIFASKKKQVCPVQRLLRFGL